MNNQRQTCKNCGRIQRFEWSVVDTLWEVTTEPGDTVLCIECWLEKVDRFLMMGDLEAEDFRFMAIVGDDGDGCVFIDKQEPNAKGGDA